MPTVDAESTVPEVKVAMNNAIGEDFWSSTGKGAWKTLCSARDNFIHQELQKLGLTIKTFNELGKMERINKTKALEAAFKNSFFQYSRSVDWMSTAVGDNEKWLEVTGIEVYHVKRALIALKRRKNDVQEHAGPSTADPVAATSGQFYDYLNDGSRGA